MFDNKVIFISGGSGFLARNLTKYILKNYNPNKIILFSRNEAKQYEAQLELDDPNMPNNNKLRWILGDIRDYKALTSAIDDSDIVAHTAACKRVQNGVYNPFEMIDINVNGTENIIRACINNYVEKLVYISSDKAVNPALLYGQTKALGEKMIQHAHVYQERHGLSMVAVRYGNVWGSTGSIVPFYKSLKEKKLPVTSTEMTRFNITVNKAILCIITALQLCKAGEILVPKLKSYKVTDLVKAFDKDYRIIGIRDQEKLDEQLLCEYDFYTDIGDYYIVSPKRENDSLCGLNYNSRDNIYLTVDELEGML